MNNTEALGYMLVAAREVGLTPRQVNDMYGHMRCAFDVKREEEADAQGHRWFREHVPNRELVYGIY